MADSALKIIVDGHPLDANEYVQNFFKVTLRAMLSTLEGGENPQQIRIVAEGDRCLELKADEQELRRKPFIHMLFARTVLGMVSALREGERAKRVELELSL